MIELRFAPYEHVDTGVLVVAFEHKSTIFYCNRYFANLLNTHPDHLIGKSVDEIMVSDRLAYERMQTLISTHARISLSGGYNATFLSQYQPKVRVLRVTGVEVHEGREGTFLLGYLRRPTALEMFIAKTKIDRHIKPMINFATAGHWRPYITAVVTTVGIPWLSVRAPEIAHLLLQLFSQQ